MINRWEVLECLREYPNKSRKQIAEHLNEDYEAIKKCIIRFRKNGWIKEVNGSWVVIKTPAINKSDDKIEIVEEMMETLLEDFKSSTKVSERIRLAELLIQLLSKFQEARMFKIDDKYYELVLEDEDIAVLQNVSTGEPLTMPIRELWNYAI